MSQLGQNELDGSESSQHPCHCSAISSMDSVRAQRDRIERSLGSTRATTSQDLPRGLEALQNAFEPMRRLDPGPSLQEDQQHSLDSSRNSEILNQQLQENPSPNSRSNEHQGSILTHHGRGITCTPRNLDLSRNLAFEAARRVQESSGIQESQHGPTPSPGPLMDPSPGMQEPRQSDLEGQLEDQRQGPAKDKVKDVQQILGPYQHHHESSRNVHDHFLSEPHAHVHKHPENFRTSSMDGGEGLMEYQHRQHHHHHGSAKMPGGVHHHGGSSMNQSLHSHGGHSLSGHHHVHGNPMCTSTTSSIPMNGPGSPVHRHHGPNGANSNSSLIMHDASPTSHRRLNLTGHHHSASNPSGFEPGHLHPTSGALSGTSSSSSLMNHGGSPTMHRHVGPGTNLSTTPLIGHRRGSSSASLTGLSSGNHHHVSSGISCESSSSTANTRTHSRLDHVHDLHHRHHHPQTGHAHGSGPETRQRTPSGLDLRHHHGHVYDHGHPHGQAGETKNPPLMAVNALQVTPAKGKCQCHAMQQSSGSKRGPDGEAEGGVDVASRTHQPPALPPRPPPRPTRRYDTSTSNERHAGEGGCCRKYVILCCLCGGLSAAVGSLFLAVHAVLSAHTASLALFETVPSYIPGTMLILMGLFTMLLARRKHRYGLLMKVCGSVGVVCALVCVLVTVTTTVVHMSRLQGLRECIYTARARSCTCYGTPQTRKDPGVLFEGTPDCEAVHGALYACLRALFGVSVAGILACIFSCMLVYQLLSHEKKKMYWEQLELRCRSLYAQGGTVGPAATSCGCCNDCGGAGPWWAQTPGNLYTPNPDMAPSRRWRLPWSRSRGPAPSPDSNYGFHTQSRQTETSADNATGPYSVLNTQSGSPYSVLNSQNGAYTPNAASYSVLETPVPLWGPPPPYSDPNSPARRPQVPEPRPRVAKRMENFETGDVDHRPRPTKRPTDNYENAEEISNSTDPEGGNEGTMKSRRARKPLKGVENGAFQQEANPASKQSESELYFGDVSSCCGPESSFYDLAVDKEGVEHSEGVDYLAAHLGKRQLSKRSRLPLPLSSDGTDHPSDNYANGDEPRTSRGPFLAPDAQYEVIQQGRYTYYSPQNGEDLQSGPATSSYFREEDPDRGRERDYRDYRNNSEEETPQCCMSDSATLDSGWQSGEQQQSDDNVRPVNV
ncbi:uncharacterized protein LOC105696222 [Orussus abietinus]|uniref:uncharacterized protein LOC105696222 n=1 Tax=Orussus abietinus TaxID=222816 RepID=UPI000C71600B|nr:uncharacterized protein LOC105696222 [Orussus abietinus]